MKVELKNLKIYEGMSEETIAFTADVSLNGKKVAYAKNDGHGGCTFYHTYDIANKPIVLEAEAYFKGLPAKKVTYGERTLDIPKSFESAIDDIVYAKYNEKENKKAEAKLKKNMSKGLCVGAPENYSIISWKGVTIEQMINRNEGRVVLRRKIEELVNKGENILNTNLPKDNFGNYLF